MQDRSSVWEWMMMILLVLGGLSLSGPSVAEPSPREPGRSTRITPQEAQYRAAVKKVQEAAHELLRARQEADRLAQGLPSDVVLCYWPGPGCPGWEENGLGDWMQRQVQLEGGPGNAHARGWGWGVDLLVGFYVKVVYCAIDVEINGPGPSPLEGPGGFNRLKDCVSSLPFSTAGGSGSWTDWLNRDDPGGSGDYETLADFAKAGLGCSSPREIECATLDGTDWRETGQTYICNLETGGLCRNDQQMNGQSCRDYKIRLRC